MLFLWDKNYKLNNSKRYKNKKHDDLIIVFFYIKLFLIKIYMINQQ